MNSMQRRLTKELAYLQEFDSITSQDNGETNESPKSIRDKAVVIFKHLKMLYGADIKNVILSPDFATLSLDFSIEGRSFTFNFTFNNYPWRPPTMLINGKPYKRCMAPKVMKYFKLNSRCLCCDSIMNLDKWNATTRLVDILLEFARLEKDYFSRVRDKTNCHSYIITKKIGFYVPICEFL